MSILRVNDGPTLIPGRGVNLTEGAPGEFTLGRPGFVGACVLTSAAATTESDAVPSTNVPTGKHALLDGFLLQLPGATAWTDTTGTVVYIKDKAGVILATIAKSALVAGAHIGPYSSGVTLSTEFLNGLTTVNSGICLVADHVFAAGTDLHLTVFGYFA